MRTSEHLFLDLPKLEPGLRKHLEKEWEREDTRWSSKAIAITNSWLKEGLKERCITRDLKWGTPVPLDGFRNKAKFILS